LANSPVSLKQEGCFVIVTVRPGHPGNTCRQKCTKLGKKRELYLLYFGIVYIQGARKPDIPVSVPMVAIFLQIY
jgi:hypothetical protein